MTPLSADLAHEPERDPPSQLWPVVRFDDAVSISEGQVDPRREPYASMIHIGPEHIESGTGRLMGGKTAREAELISGKYRFHSGDVVYSKIRPYLRKAAWVDFDGLCSADMYPLSVRDGFDARWVLFLALSDGFTQQTVSQQDRTGIPKVNRDQLGRVLIPKPSLPEQQAIAAVLSSIQAAVTVQDRMVATLRELKAATMAKLFREGLRGESLKQTEIGEIPEPWTVVELQEICREPDGLIQTGPFGSQLHASDYIASGIPIVNPTHLEDDRVRHDDIPEVSESDAIRLKRHRLSEGDILFSRRGDVGRHAHIFQEEEGWLCGTGCLIVRPSKTKVFSLYLSYFLSTSSAQDYLKNQAVGSIMPNINTKILARMPVPVPPYADQETIAVFLHALDEQIRSCVARIATTKALFASMLHLTMTGLIRVGPGPLSESFVTELVRRFEPERVILFGEKAEGSPTAWAEVGLLVEMEFEGLGRDHGARIMREIPRGFALDVVVRRPGELRQAAEIGDRFLSGIVERGQVLYARPAGQARSAPSAGPEAKTAPRPRLALNEDVLAEIVRRIVDAARPEQIVLFGSGARSEMGPDSDVDLLVVKACVDRREMALTISRALRGVAPGLPKDVIVVTPEDVERDRDTIGYIIRPALREGRVIYAA